MYEGDDPSIPGEGCKRPGCELTTISSNSGDWSEICWSGKLTKVFSTLSKTRNMKLEQGSWSSSPNGTFPSSSVSSSIKEVSSFPSESTRESGFKAHSTDPDPDPDPKGGESCEKKDIIFSDESNAADTYTFSDDLGDVTQTSNNIDFFENFKEKDPGDFLYDGWPEIGNFDDVDRMFRSSDSTFGLGATDFTFPLPETYPGKDLLQNDDPNETCYVDDPAMNCAPTFLKDSSWSADIYESSLAKGPAMTESKDEFFPEKEMDGHRKQSKNQNQSDGNMKRHYFGNVNYNCLDQTTVNLTSSSMKFHTKDLINPSLGESSHASSQLQSLEGFHHSYLVSAIVGNENRENIYHHRGSPQSMNKNLGNIRVTLQPSTTEFESPCDIDDTDSVVLAELGSSNVLESSAENSGLDDISFEAASFLQLQLVMEQLDLRTKLCIRDSLYRLSRSAQRRHNHANQDDACGDEREASRSFVTDRINKHTGSMDMETNTNPIDRSIAHLLFHRSSDTYAVPANDSLQFRSPTMVHGSLTTTIMVDNLVCGEENCTEIDKGGSNR